MSTVTIRLFRQPSAFIPIAMSLAGLSLLLGTLATVGVTREPDEGAPAHVWQLLMAGQLPVIGYFALKWLPRRPTEALAVLMVQLATGLAAAAPVFLLRL